MHRVRRVYMFRRRNTPRTSVRLCMYVWCVHGAEGKRHATEHEKRRARRGAAEAREGNRARQTVISGGKHDA